MSSSNDILQELEKLTVELRGRVSHLRTLPGSAAMDLSPYDVVAERVQSVAAKLRNEPAGQNCGASHPMMEPIRPGGMTAKALCDSASENSQGCRPTRLVYDHRVNGLNDAITIRPIGEPGPGGAHTRYVLELACPEDRSPVPRKTLDIQFQSRPISGPTDFDGWTNESLIAVVIDRIRGFQRAQFACRDNAIALTHMEDALMRLQNRTRDRMARGVEGSNRV